MQNAQKLDAQIFQYLFVFRRDGITIQLFEESRPGAATVKPRCFRA